VVGITATWFLLGCGLDEQRGLQLENAEAERFWTSLQDMNQSTVDALPAPCGGMRSLDAAAVVEPSWKPAA
jgi:hypothetical protein